MHPFLLRNGTAENLYRAVRDLPIIDYHCHLSPREIWEDRPFDNLGELWLSSDHYKWRLMRAAGVEERYVTGDAPYRERFLRYAGALEFAAGNPLYHWSHMELSRFFGIDVPIRADTAEGIYDRAGACIRERRLSPRAVLREARVELLCTTDDPADPLTFHDKLRSDPTFGTVVLPSFRADRLLTTADGGYLAYLRRLSEAAGVPVTDLGSLKEAARRRLRYFKERGCRVSDMGIPSFPRAVSDEGRARRAFARLLRGRRLTDGESEGLCGHLLVFLGRLYAEEDVLMQWRLSPLRDANQALFRALGPDAGGDCVGDPVRSADVAAALNGIQDGGRLPRTILYSVDSGSAARLASIAGSFPRVQCGAAWWFCDHKRGIREELEVVAEHGALGSFLGMLTDSRSFLSFARHDYFRRILCSLVGEWIEDGEYDPTLGEALVRKLCYGNLRDAFGGGV